jgi:EAL domain-containing protein (putative c-di-GMP-specific phosphodiesterase class I)
MLSTGRIVGLEALVRWQHPRLGHLPPAEFIGLAERTGLIGEVGEFVLRTACADGQRWRQLPGYGDLRLGVNLSARQLAEPALVATVMGALRDSGLESSGLILEITESLLVSATGEGGDRLKQLRANGVRLALDDFGTGYSSLAYLRDFDVQVMKLDRSFISRLADDPPAAHLVRAILHLAASLSLDVVAEGVERPEDLATLQDMGCGFVQGFLFARPAPAPGIAGLLAGWDATRWTPARSGSG